jgi:hypothetical protein
MASAGLLSTGIQSGASLASVTDLLSQPAPVAEPERSQSDRSYGRTVSMSGIDVWGNMALGDRRLAPIPTRMRQLRVGMDQRQRVSPLRNPMAMPLR